MTTDHNAVTVVEMKPPLPASPTLSVFVQCPTAPRAGFERCQASIEASDIGKNYEVVTQEPGVSLMDHFIGLLRHMGQAKTDLVVRLEDDVDVNQFIVHNLTHWPAIFDPRFLIGWVFDPHGSCKTIHDYMYGRAATADRWVEGSIAYSQAGLMWTRDMNDIANACEIFWKKVRPDLSGSSQDIALSSTPKILRRGQVVVHAPSLVEHMGELPSTLTHQYERATSGGTFVRDWKRS